MTELNRHVKNTALFDRFLYMIAGNFLQEKRAGNAPKELFTDAEWDSSDDTWQLCYTYIHIFSPVTNPATAINK